MMKLYRLFLTQFYQAKAKLSKKTTFLPENQDHFKLFV